MSFPSEFDYEMIVSQGEKKQYYGNMRLLKNINGNKYALQFLTIEEGKEKVIEFDYPHMYYRSLLIMKEIEAFMKRNIIFLFQKR